MTTHHMVETNAPGHLHSHLAHLSPFQDSPIVFLTALANNDATGGHAVVAGSTVYLAKPVDTAELIKCIEQTLFTAAQPQHRVLSPRP